MTPLIGWLLTINSGYVDAAGFLSLNGLFTAHVTGNIVTLCASLVFGTSGAIAKLLALPVFWLVVALAHVLGRALANRPRGRPRLMLLIELIVLIAACVLAIRLGPFGHGNGGGGLATGMTLVSAMAIQNGLQRLHLPANPPTTRMTGSTTQLALDTIDIIAPGTSKSDRDSTLKSAANVAGALGCFAFGCAAAAVLFWQFSTMCFVVPPLITFVILVISEITPQSGTAQRKAE